MASVTDRNYPEFKKSYTTALNSKRLTFDFEGQEILTAYAKYVCQFVDGENLRKQKANLN